MLTFRSEGDPQQRVVIPREVGQVQFQMKVEEDDARSFRAAIRAVDGARAWTRRSLKPRSGEVSVNIPASKLPLGDYILTLSATIATGESEEVNRYFFRVSRK
jgi:hypothetical protein